MDIEPYLDQEADRSTAFTERVAALADALATGLGVPVRHDADMNYRTGQLIKMYVGPSGTPVRGEPEASYLLAVAVSGKGPLWTVLAWRKRGEPPAWHPIPPAEVPAADLLDTAGRLATAAGLARVPENRLEEPVPGHVTDMDAAPATVRDVLFCEVC